MKIRRFAIYVKKNFVLIKKIKKEFKKMQKFIDHCHYTRQYRGAAHSNCNLKYRATKKVPVVFHNGSTYDYHFIIKQLAREFKGSFECLGENTEKCITFSVPIKKEHDNGKPLKKNMTMVKQLKNNMTMVKQLKKNMAIVKQLKKNMTMVKQLKKRKTTTCKLKPIDSYRFMQCSLSTLVDNLSGNDKKESCNKFTDSMRSMTDSLSQSIDKVSEIDREISQIDEKEPKNKFIDNMKSMMTSLSQSINKISEIDRKISQIDKKEQKNKSIENMRSMVSSLSQSIDKVSEIDKKISYAALIEKFPNTYQLCNKDLNKFALLLRKGVYPYEYMDCSEKFKEESLPDK